MALATELVHKKCERCSRGIDITGMDDNNIVSFVAPNGDVRHIWLCRPCIIMFGEWLGVPVWRH